MILNRLTLVNFGIYRGEKIFDLCPDSDRPIIIIGGKNGAGKTTLLDAIRLCLYGSLALDQSARPNKAAYEQYLRQRIHYSSNGVIPIDLASVELDFEYATAGERRIYTIKREWCNKPDRFEEKLLVFENTKLLQDMDANQWQDFLKELIPPGLSQLFFFDGEKIQALADDGPNNLALAEATKALLGLNIVDQLRNDLTIYRRRQQKGNDLDSAEREITLLEDELSQINTDLQKLELEQIQLKSVYDEVDNKIKLQEQEIAQVGGGFALKRNQYKDAEIRLKIEIDQVEQSIRDLCAELLPFAIAPDYTSATREQLLREAAYDQWEASKSFIEQKYDALQREIAQDDFWQDSDAEISPDLRRTIGDRVVSTLGHLTKPPETVEQTKRLHQVSALERQRLLQWIDESQTTTPNQLHTLTNRLAKLNEERDQTEQALQRVPEDDVLAPLVETLNQHHRELGTITEQVKQIEETRRKLEFDKAELDRKRIKAMEKRTKSEKLSRKIHQVIDVSLALNDFTTKLTELRIKQLQERFTNNFNRLCRKNRLIENVNINHQDFSITLVSDDGQITAKRDLSAGEKQIYAIAMLWALRQVSGRPLPVIIDTPLGRLDSDHRQNLVEQYFPRASHQVILFSTDTEVDVEFFSEMQPKIARAYHLNHDEAQQATIVQEGYFWNENGSNAQ